MSPRRLNWGLARAVLLVFAGGAGVSLFVAVAIGAGEPLRRASAHRVRSGARSSAAVKLTVEVNGDLLIHEPVWQRALQDGHGTYDFSPMLREVAP